MTLRPDLPPLLVPRPRRMKLTGGRVAVDCACAAERVDRGADLPFPGEEAYRLHITHAVQAPLVIESRTEAGLRCARATLHQLVQQYGEMLPCMMIEDGPAIAIRGYMLDVSRNRVPTMAHLREIIDLLASLKFNHLQLYTEHAFAYAGHDEVWKDASPITPDELRELDRVCRERGIELASNQNCFGHLSSWLRLPRYALLAETHGEWYFENGGQRWRRSGPFSLCPIDPGSEALVEDLLGQLLPCLTSALVNIGCDETFDVGYGRSAEAVRQRGRASVYFEFVDKVAAIARRHGRRPMFWADIAMSHVEHAHLIAGDMIRLAWGYEGDTPWCEWLRVLRGGEVDAESDRSETWVCPGTSSWRSITGRTTERRENIEGAVRAGTSHGARGMLLTDWGDCGHRQQWVTSLGAIAQAAEAAWSGSSTSLDQHAVSLHVLGDDRLRAAGWLDELGDVDLALRRIGGSRGRAEEALPLRNASALFTDLHFPIHRAEGDAGPGAHLLDTESAMWRETEERLCQLESTMPRLSSPLRAEVEHTMRIAKFAARRAVLRRSGGGLASSDARQLAAEYQEIVDGFRALWAARSRPGGLEASCEHDYRIIEDLLS